MWTAFKEWSKAAVASRKELALQSSRNTKRGVASLVGSSMAWD